MISANWRSIMYGGSKTAGFDLVWSSKVEVASVLAAGVVLDRRVSGASGGEVNTRVVSYAIVVRRN
jgi:hypothetical protein